jgi:hypothetical protein
MVIELLQLTGIAAILRFPMPDIEEDLLSDSDEEETNESNKSTTAPSLTASHAHETFKSNGHIYISSEPMSSLDSQQQLSTLTNSSNNSSFSNLKISGNEEDKNPQAAATKSIVASKLKSVGGAQASASSPAITVSSATALNNNSKKNTKRNKENYHSKGRDYDQDDDDDDGDEYEMYQHRFY